METEERETQHSNELRSVGTEPFLAKRVWLKALLAIGALCLAAACDSSLPEERLEASQEALERVEAELAEAQREVEVRSRALAEVEQRLVQARKAAARLEKRQETAEQRLAQRATDVVLFRALQQELLEREALASVAIVAEVQDREVTLRGAVPEPSLRREAETIARATQGVGAVRNRIRLESAVQPGDPTRYDMGEK